jgi:hypothetical protein
MAAAPEAQHEHVQTFKCTLNRILSDYFTRDDLEQPVTHEHIRQAIDDFVSRATRIEFHRNLLLKVYVQFAFDNGSDFSELAKYQFHRKLQQLVSDCSGQSGRILDLNAQDMPDDFWQSEEEWVEPIRDRLWSAFEVFRDSLHTNQHGTPCRWTDGHLMAHIVQELADDYEVMKTIVVAAG